MNTNKKSLLAFTILLTLCLGALGMFGATGLVKNTQRQDAINQKMNELQKDGDEIDEQSTATSTNPNTIDMLMSVDLDNMQGKIFPTSPKFVKLAIILISSVILMIVPCFLIFRKTEEDENYEKKIEKKKQQNDRFIDCATSDGVKKIAKALQKGEVVIMPCDTIWGICALADEANIPKILKVKKREDPKFITLCTKPEAREILGSNCPNNIYDIWPAPLTVIGCKKASKDTIAIRVPNDKTLSKIISKTGPIFSTSVNISGEKPLNDFEEIREKFSNDVSVIAYDSKKQLIGIESTIIDITAPPYKVIREGSIKKKDLRI